MRKQRIKRFISALLAFTPSLSGVVSYFPSYAEEESEITVSEEDDYQNADVEEAPADEAMAEAETEPIDPQKYNLTLLYNEEIEFTFDDTAFDSQDEESKDIVLTYEPMEKVEITLSIADGMELTDLRLVDHDKNDVEFTWSEEEMKLTFDMPEKDIWLYSTFTEMQERETAGIKELSADGEEATADSDVENTFDQEALVQEETGAETESFAEEPDAGIESKLAEDYESYADDSQPAERFYTQERWNDKKLKRDNVEEIPLYKLHQNHNYPYKVKEDATLFGLVNSIKENGVLEAAIARPDPDGGYELIAGHRRKRACEIAGKKTMPVLVLDLDDDEATILMVDSNLLRENVLRSEMANSFKIKIDALNHQGKKKGDGIDNDTGKTLWSRDQVAKDSGISGTQVERYVHLTELISPLLDDLDDNKIAFNTAYKLSFLTKDEQHMLLDFMENNGVYPLLAQANELKILSEKGDLNIETISRIFTEKKSKKKIIAFNEDELRRYFPEGTTTSQMKDEIIKYLEERSKENKSDSSSENENEKPDQQEENSKSQSEESENKISKS